MGAFEIIMILYVFWAWFAGWKFLTGRIAWCEQPGVPNKIVKAILSIIVGYVIGAFYLIYWIFKLIFRFGS